MTALNNGAITPQKHVFFSVMDPFGEIILMGFSFAFLYALIYLHAGLTILQTSVLLYVLLLIISGVKTTLERVLGYVQCILLYH